MIRAVNTIITLIFCIMKKRYFVFDPKYEQYRNHIIIKQYNLKLVHHMIWYIFDVVAYFDNTYQLYHHIITIFMFTTVIFQSNIITVSFLIPDLIHGVYLAFFHDCDFFLYAYNFSLIANFIIFFGKSLQKTVSLKVPIFEFFFIC